MRIVLDAMGGDYAPPVAVEGAVMAAREFGIEVVLVGREDEVRTELAKHDTSGLKLPIVHASQVIEMQEHPAAAVKAKPDSSMVVGMKMLRRGEADAFVSAGNSGGVLAAALFHLGRIKGIKRPALSTIYPFFDKEKKAASYCFLIDVGANAECKPENLLQFALMGHVYAEKILGIENPRIGLLSNGEEETKGTVVVQEAHQLLKQSGLNFIGNVEGKDIPMGMADVVVTDGFTGNVVVKLSEGLAMALFSFLKVEIEKRPLATLGALLARPAFKAMAKVLDYREYGGGALLGVDGVVIIAHGRSDAIAIKNAIRVARKAVETRMIEAIKQGLEELLPSIPGKGA
ncbi:MAG TPA: phosphate acyltransferase PlsX [Chloroflexi bacterium]|nr:phosphate acyltransferase PlsX [Chloroflexota bacterium]